MAAAGSAEAQLVQQRMQQRGQDDADDLDDLSLAWKRAGEVTPRHLTIFLPGLRFHTWAAFSHRHCVCDRRGGRGAAPGTAGVAGSRTAR